MKAVYWSSTLLVVGFLVLSSYSYFFSKATIEGIKDLGFPNFFRIQLGLLKIVAAFLLLIPGVPLFLKDWSYAGVGLFLLTAFVAHVTHKDSITLLILLIFLFLCLATSRYYLTAMAMQ